MKIKRWILWTLKNFKKRWITIDFVGDKGEKQIHSKSILFNPEKECLCIDWTNKEVHIYGKKNFLRKNL